MQLRPTRPRRQPITVWRETRRRIHTRDGVPLPDPCDADAVRRLWKLAARRTHPDAGGSHDAFIAAKQHYEAAARVAERTQ